MRLELVQKALKEKGIPYNYTEEDGCGSIDFLFRGIPYHVWEFEDDGWGAETNIENSAENCRYDSGVAGDGAAVTELSEQFSFPLFREVSRCFGSGIPRPVGRNHFLPVDISPPLC